MVKERIPEKLVHMNNIRKENSLIVTGLESKVAMPVDRAEQRKWLTGLVGAALDYLVQDSSKGIVFVTSGRRVEGGVPTMCKVRKKDKEMVVVIRREASLDLCEDGLSMYIDF